MSNESWRAFGTDTEAGRLLQKLYGKNKHERASRIQYPTPSVSRSTAPPPAFIPGGGSVGSNSRTSRIKRNPKIYVPKVGRKKYARPAPIDMMRGRQRRIDSKKAVRDVEEFQEMYRPPLKGRAHSTAAEKDMLRMNFEFGGGKALPASAMREPLSAEAVEDLRAGKPIQRPPRAPKQSEEEKMFDQVMTEIEERRSFLAEMHALGNRKHDAIVTQEIQERIKDLKLLDEMIQAEKKETKRGRGRGGSPRRRGQGASPRSG